MEVLRLGDGPLEVTILPHAGARLHRLRAFGVDLLRTPDDPETHLRDPFFWGAYPMAPWCNRITATPTTVGARTVALASNFADGSAIHGQVYARPWTVEGDVLNVTGGGDGWPWPYALDLRVTVRGASLRLALTLTNRSDAPMPAGLGLHPWWRRPALLRVPGNAAYRSNLDAAAAAQPVTGRFDLQEQRVPEDGLDATWTKLHGRPVELAWPELGVQASLRASATLDHVAVATPAGIDAIAVEPQTHAPGGLARMLRGEPGGLALLAPGATLEAALEIEVAYARDVER